MGDYPKIVLCMIILIWIYFLIYMLFIVFSSVKEHVNWFFTNWQDDKDDIIFIPGTSTYGTSNIEFAIDTLKTGTL